MRGHIVFLGYVLNMVSCDTSRMATTKSKNRSIVDDSRIGTSVSLSKLNGHTLHVNTIHTLLDTI